MKQFKQEDLLYNLWLFYRYNWSIETLYLIAFAIFLLRFYRYNWSIETLCILLSFLIAALILPIQLEYWNHSCLISSARAFIYSTDTIGVLKRHNIYNFFPVILFYRYNWSIETKLSMQFINKFRRFYRYNWSIETKKTGIIFSLFTLFYRYNWSIETNQNEQLYDFLQGFYRYNWSIETSLLIFLSKILTAFYRYNWSIETLFF